MARKAVVSNASVWDTQHLLQGSPEESGWRQEAMQTPMTGSFMHLHLGDAFHSAEHCIDSRQAQPCTPPEAACSHPDGS